MYRLFWGCSYQCVSNSVREEISWLENVEGEVLGKEVHVFV